MDVDDVQLVKVLASQDAAVCNQAAEEILRRGERMIGFLLQQQGSMAPYGGTFGNPKGSTATIVPLPGFVLSPAQQENVVTVEMAALYLISAIYYGRLSFSNSALLMDQRLDPIDRKATNNQEYVVRAFRSAREWASECKRVGLENLRARKEDPLKRAELDWW